MLPNWIYFTLLTLSNALICLSLPRLLTLDWTRLFSRFKGNARTTRAPRSSAHAPHSEPSA